MSLIAWITKGSNNCSRILVTAVVFLVTAAVVNARPSSHYSAQKRGTGVKFYVLSESDFCSYLPKEPGQLISESEDDATAFCTVSHDDQTETFPEGFIKSAHFYQTSSFVQVTGQIDHTAYDIQTGDGGGQYDQKNLPNAVCNDNLKYWVNVIEPDSDRFCIRCCEKKEDCNIGISTYGCERIVPGDYD
ncbi:hypothetical protein BDF20DRAFT_914922 [Mycotypha africana]|uniref:uncharacterized protein n=1 Tax=Mycotypha africana TaxID=64632 RepID=UPI00230096C9|nr:uncharacterized protein BDF20DRAFT_914922 [Mycotypha africana]KAI8973487.1 hypothetical protein BDF20DRAFT_914922 [Mycotypha africana]